jgi:hypothetical protein
LQWHFAFVRARALENVSSSLRETPVETGIAEEPQPTERAFRDLDLPQVIQSRRVPEVV